MSSQPPKKAKKPAVEYTVEYDESGAMRRVPVPQASQRPAQQQPQQPVLIPLPPVQPRTSIVSSAVAASQQQGVHNTNANEVEEEILVLNDLGPEDDNVMVFTNQGEVTGDERRRIIAEQEAKAKAEAEAEKKAKAEAERKERKPSKAEKTFAELTGVEKMKFFYRLRAKNPLFFRYTAEGNLQILPNNPAKIPAETIPLRAFSALKPEELEEILTKQKEEQSEVEKRYVVKMKELRAANDNYLEGNMESILNIVKLNQELRELSILRNKTSFPERWTNVLDNPSTNIILLNEEKEERKLGYEVFVFKRSPLKRQDAEGHYRAHGEVAGEEMKGGGTMVIFITNPDDQQSGAFHPATEKEFVYNETKYVSPYQAYETERFKQMEDDEMVKKLLGTRSAKTIRELASKDPRKVPHPLELWEEILEAFYTQFKDAAERLKSTGSARFHMMDKLFGSPEYANALANVRTKLKERETDAAPMADAIKQSVISEDEQKKAKVGAIINNFRRNG